MKKLWVNADPYKKDVIISVFESGAEAVVLLSTKWSTKEPASKRQSRHYRDNTNRKARRDRGEKIQNKRTKSR